MMDDVFIVIFTTILLYNKTVVQFLYCWILNSLEFRVRKNSKNVGTHNLDLSVFGVLKKFDMYNLKKTIPTVPSISKIQ